MKRIVEKNPNTREYWLIANEHPRMQINFDHRPDTTHEILKWIDGGDSILDIGAGAGMVIRRIRDVCTQSHIEITDFMPETIDWLKKKMPDLNGYFVSNLVEGISKPDKSYDVVMATEVLEHLEDPKAAVKEMARLARKKVIITVPFREYGRRSTQHVWEYGLDDIFDFMSPYGKVHITVPDVTHIVGVLCLK